MQFESEAEREQHVWVLAALYAHLEGRERNRAQAAERAGITFHSAEVADAWAGASPRRIALAVLALRRGVKAGDAATAAQGRAILARLGVALAGPVPASAASRVAACGGGS